MDSPLRYDRLSRICWRSLVAAAGCWSAVAAWQTGHSATSLLLTGAGLLAAGDIVAAVSPRSASALAPTGDLASEQTVERLRALLDAVGPALFAIGDDGRIGFANRAANRRAGGEIVNLDDASVLDHSAVAALRALPAGARRIVRARDGRSLLAWAGSFTVPGERPQRLLSLQWIAGELDAVEMEAWHAMTRVLTHEMMNSLTPIVSLAESLVDGAAHGEAARAASVTIARRGSHLLRFVERYRALGDLPRPEPVAFDLAIFVEDLARSMGTTFASEHILINAEVGDGPAMILGDPDLIERAIINLLHNAREAVEKEDRRVIRLTLARCVDQWSIIVADSGPGISPEHAEDVFVPFFSTKPGGSGIGLPLARQIALMHGGSLTIAAHDGVGTWVDFRLPHTA